MKLALEMVLKGGRVARFHTAPTIKCETVAEHSYLVAWLATLIVGAPRAELLLACLAHDLPEYVLGDMPSPAKKRLGMREAFRREEVSLYAAAGMPDYEAMLTPQECEVLKFSDNLAGYLKCKYEAQMGNTLLREMADRYHEYIYDMIKVTEYLDKPTIESILHDILR